MAEMTEEEFLKIWQDSAQAPRPEIEYRLYYDGDGFPLFVTTQDEPGQYINIDQQTYLCGVKNVRVLDGKIVEAQICWTKKLVPSQQGQSCHPTDVCVIVDADQEHVKWRLKYEDLINDKIS